MADPFRRGDWLILDLRNENIAFRAELFHPVTGNQLEEFQLDSYLRVVGVCSVGGDRTKAPTVFRILLRSPEDIVLLRPPPRWSLHEIAAMFGAVSILALGFLAWSFSLRFQVRRKTSDIQRLNESLENRIAQRTADLEIANKELESFSYSVSHDLKAPLRAIAGFSRFLEEDHASSLNQDGQQLIGRIRENTERMNQLIDNLLVFSKFSRMELHRAAINMTDLARECFRELKAQEENRQIEFSLDSLPESSGDPAMMRQVYLNLFSNALKYTRPRKVARIEAGFQIVDGRTVYYVRDNGIGFDMQYADKLFDAFQRLHSSKDFEGTGVGLALVQQIIHRHRGQIWAESELNKGTTFSFTLGSR